MTAGAEREGPGEQEIPGHWGLDSHDAPDFIVLRIEEGLGYLRTKARLVAIPNLDEDLETEYFFSSAGEEVSRRKIYQHKRVVEYVEDDAVREVSIQGNPRGKEIFTPAYEDGVVIEFQNFFFQNQCNLGDLFYKEDGFLDAAYLLETFFSTDDEFIPSPSIRFVPTFSEDGTLESLLPDEEEFEADNAEENVDEGATSYHLLLDAEIPEAYVVTDEFDTPLFKLRTSVRGEWGIIEQENIEFVPGIGVTKKLRFRAKVPARQVFDVLCSETFHPQTGELVGAWRNVGAMLGNPSLTFKGPVAELLEAIKDEQQA